MKIVIVLIAVWLLIWLLGSAKRRRAAVERKQPRGPAVPQPMLACSHCGLHLPRDEALPGRGGMFCGAEHRAAFERAQTPA